MIVYMKLAILILTKAVKIYQNKNGKLNGNVSMTDAYNYFQ